jgi:tripartite-type tricarboxylate transporter receptor subunit TctC
MEPLWQHVDEKAPDEATKPIKVVVAAPPGGGSDVLARLMAEHIGRAQGVTVMVENRPGASTAIGTEAVARAAPDGSTLLIVTPAFVINPYLRTQTYDPLTSFVPICNLVRSPQLIVVNSALPYRTLGDLLSEARIKSGKLTLAAAGPATSVHIAFERLKRAANVNMTFVPYPGDAPAVNAALGEHVTSAFVPYSGVAEQLQAGKLRALATASQERIMALPDVPTLIESGYDDIDADIWQGVVAPANTPKETIARLVDWFSAALQMPEVKAKLLPLALYPVGTCGAEFAALLRKKTDEFGRGIREAGIKAD